MALPGLDLHIGWAGHRFRDRRRILRFVQSSDPEWIYYDATYAIEPGTIITGTMRPGTGRLYLASAATARARAPLCCAQHRRHSLSGQPGVQLHR